LSPGDPSDILLRLHRLNPRGTPCRGSATPVALLCRLADPLRVSLDAKTAKRRKTALGIPDVA